MQSYINNIKETNEKKLFYILKKKNIKYQLDNDFINFFVGDNNFILYYDNYKPQFIIYNQSNIIFQKICEDININIDNYDFVEDIIYKIYNEYNIIKEARVSYAHEKKKNIALFAKELETAKNNYLDKCKNDNANIKNDNISISNKKASLFSLRACVEMYGDQLIKIYSNENFDVDINDFPNVKIIMDKFTFVGSIDLIVNIEMNINLHALNQQPKINLSSNKLLQDNILQVICQLKPFSDINSWLIKYSIYDSVVNIFNMINKFGEIKKEYANEFDKITNNLEYLLSIKNENISEIKLLELFDKDLLNKKNSTNSNPDKKTNNNEYWKQGTGYGHNGVKEWNIDEYIEQVNNKKKNILSEYNKLLALLTYSSNNLGECDIELLVTLLLNYIQNEEITNENVIMISDIIEKNINLLNVPNSKYQNKFIKLLDLVKEYLIENNIAHKLNQNNVISEIIQISNQNKNITINDPFIKLFDKYKFQMYPNEFKNFYYSNQLVNLGSEQILRLGKEFNICKKSIEINTNASIFFYVQRDKINKIKFIISGPLDTPYEQGLYIFDMTVGKDFPSKPPQVHFVNHGGQRFNPNLYNCGKVCLSLLGTWRGDKGESWNSSTSSFFQVIISIQSQILIDEPYFNEPGYESYIGKPQGISNSKNYNYNIRQYNLDYAINGLIENVLSDNNSYPEFTDIIKNYFKYKKDKILETLNKWEEEVKLESGKNMFNNFTNSKNKFIELVNKL